jgi:hypothetical protein
MADHTVGNGGDPIFVLFTDARYDAQAMLASLASAGLPAGVDPRVRDFLMKVDPASHKPLYLAMADDVVQDQQTWQGGDVGPVGRCATTNVPATAANPNGRATDIYLSIPNCHTALLAAPAAAEMAARILIRESCHHFGLGDDQDPEGIDDGDVENLVSKVVYNVWLAQRNGRALVWRDTPSAGAPSGRFRHTAVWTGVIPDPKASEQVLIWGGCNDSPLPSPDACGRYLGDGARLQVIRHTSDGVADAQAWLPMDQSTAPAGRAYHTAVWTGAADVGGISNRMIIFGGCRGVDGACNESLAITACANAACTDGNRDHVIYDPAGDRWTAAATDGAPSPRVSHTAVWTGASMVVWGGLSGFQTNGAAALGDGGVLTFSDAAPQGVWTPLKAGGGSPPPRFDHTATWTGAEMIVWGGCSQPGVLAPCKSFLADGAAFDPGKGTWRPLPPAPIAARSGHAALWTGRYLIIWGGRNGTGVLSDGAIFDGQNRVWRQMSAVLPAGESGRYGHQAVWDGLQGRMVIWGGAGPGDREPTSTLVFDPQQGSYGTWSEVAVAAGPVGRRGGIALWLEDALMVWGGLDGSGVYASSGALLSP